MIISLRGTNGAGKSTIVRAIMEHYPEIIRLQYPKEMGKKLKPTGYICSGNNGTKKLFIPGHYEIPNGGIDTLPSLEYAYKLILKHHEFGADVLAEGKNMSDGVQRIVAMHSKKLDVKVVFIDHPVQACIDAVRERGHSISISTIIKLADKCEKEYRTLTKIGVPCLALSREEAFDQIKEWLGVNHVSK
jgi:hypothetical protein